jgi:hypothetical protein
MPSERLILALIVIGAPVTLLVWGLGGGAVLRRRLIHLLQNDHPVIWARAVNSADMPDHIGRRVPSSTLLLRLVADAERGGVSDPRLHLTALWLRGANAALIVCILCLSALALGTALWPR